MANSHHINSLRLLLPLFLGMLVSACATTSGGRSSSDYSASSSEQVAGECTNDAQQNCVHHGQIEITEDHSVDSEIRDEFNQSIELLKQEKYPEAIRLLKTVTGKTSKFTAPFINLGIAYERTDEEAKAEESLKKALSINPQHPVALNELGLVYRKTGRFQEARKVYEKLLRIYPDFVPVHKNYGVLCDIYMQDLNCALEQFEAYLQAYPDDAKVKIWVADVKNRM